MKVHTKRKLIGHLVLIVIGFLMALFSNFFSNMLSFGSNPLTRGLVFFVGLILVISSISALTRFYFHGDM